MWTTKDRVTTSLRKLACVVGVVLCVATTGAASIVDSGGFENPPYTMIDLAGQDDWVTVGGGGGSAAVQGTVAYPDAGSQAVRVDRGANSDDYWFVPINETPTWQIAIDWDMWVEEADGDQTYGPFFGVQAYDYAGAEFGVLGTFGVDAHTGEILYQRADTEAFDITPNNDTVPFDTWQHYQLLLDFSEDQYTIFLNGQPLLTEDFVSSEIGHDLNEFTDADIAALAAGAGVDNQAAIGTAYVDNFQVTVVPEPSSLVLMLAGVSGMLLWRTRRRR